MKIEMPQLPFEVGDLEPIVSANTITFHYGKHLQGYVNALQSVIKGTEYDGKSIEEIVKNAPNGAIYNNAGQIFNHVFYFLQLCKSKVNNKPQGKLLKAIEDTFGSFEEFQTQFTQAALTQFGSGWAWLSEDKDGKLIITKESNAECPLRKGLNPLFVIDVWEHAYYLDYQNRRADYVAALWSIVDWSVIEKRMK